LTGLLIVLKGLPLAYGKDMQEDKEPVFDAADSLSLALAAMAGMVSDLEVDTAAMEAALTDGFPTATDLADWLVRGLGMPFRRAHHVTGRIVSLAEKRGCHLADLPLDAMQKVEAGITKDIYTVLSNAASVNSRTSFGGTAPARVAEPALAAAAAVDQERVPRDVLHQRAAVAVADQPPRRLDRQLAQPVVLFDQSITKVYLRFSGTMDKRYKYLPALTLDLSDSLLYLGLSPCIALRLQTLKNTPGAMSLLTGKLLVISDYLANAIQVRAQLRLGTYCAQTITWRFTES